MTAPSLRDRSKARRRDAIERAALRLFARQGYDATTVAEIAAEAEVAPRTVSLYFPSKIDLVLAHAEQASARLVVALERRSPDESLVDAFGAWLREEHATTDPGLRRLRAAAFAANPGLKAVHGVQTEQAITVGLRAIADQLGLSPDHHAVHVVVAAVVGLLTEFETMFADTDDADAVLETIMAFLAGGIAALAAEPT